MYVMITTRAGFEMESFESHQDSKTYRFEYDQNTTSPSMAVVAALSEVLETDPTALEPLHNSVDVDALDTVLRVRNTPTGDVRVTLTYEGYAITIHSYGVITVAPPEYVGTDDPNQEAEHR